MPPPPFLSSILLRSSIIWVGLRGMLFILFTLVVPSFAAAALIVGVTALLTTMEGRRRNEHVFLANLGVQVWSLALVAAVLPLVGELAVRLLRD